MAIAYIYDAVRTPRGRGKTDGILHDTQPVHLLTTLLGAIKDRNNLDVSLVEDAIIGCVTPIGEQGADIARTAVLAAGYNYTTAGVQVNRFCSSGLEAINMASAIIASGNSDMIIAGGVESMSRVPMSSDGGAIFMNPQIIANHKMIPQGISADLIATKYGYTRKQLDELSVKSHKRALHAQNEGRFNNSIIPVKDHIGLIVADKDEGIRPDSSVESLAKLNPAFAMMGQMGGLDALALQKYPEIAEINHVHHAGNSSQISDGAGLMLIGSKEAGEAAGLKPRAKIHSFTIVGSEPTIMLTGPVPAARKLFKRQGLKASDIDIYEINEAFAAIPTLFVDELGLDFSNVNVNGGAIAMGHPLGATGAIILGTLLDELERQDKQMGLASLCIGVGMGIATIIERV